jgi:ferredoxin
MIIAERKPFAEIKAAVDQYDNILIAGCGTCVAVCLVGGEKEVGLLASQLKLALGQEGRHPNIAEMTVERQCDREFMRSLSDAAPAYDVVISTACGAGVQFLAALPGMKPVIPALNTTFIGVNEEAGFYT